MGCVKPVSSVESLQAESLSQWNTACPNKRLARSLSYPLSKSVLSPRVCPIYESEDNAFRKSISNGAKGSSIIRTPSSVLEKQNFGSALVSSSLYHGKLKRRGNARRSLLANASLNSIETVEAEQVSIGGLSFPKRALDVVVAAAIMVILSLTNRVLYKLALVPMKNYPFLLALINTFGYVLVYFSILCIRYQAGIVTDEMLELPKWRFGLAGSLEAVGIASGMAATAILPGAALPILAQSFLVWQLVFSIIFLKKRYSFSQMLGCAMVLAGVIIAIGRRGNGLVSSADGIGLFWPLLQVLSSGFQAGAITVKEFVFRDASKRLKGGSVDIFVVNSFGSAFQSLVVLLLLPFLSQLRGIPFSQLPQYVKDGAGCLFNIGTSRTECNGATLLTLTYVVANLSFNISVLSLLKMSSAVVTSLCTAIAVPLAIYIFTLPLPYIGAPVLLPPQFFVGTVVLLGGLVSYNFSGQFKKLAKD